MLNDSPLNFDYIKVIKEATDNFSWRNGPLSPPERTQFIFGERDLIAPIERWKDVFGDRFRMELVRGANHMVLGMHPHTINKVLNFIKRS